MEVKIKFRYQNIGWKIALNVSVLLFLASLGHLRIDVVATDITTLDRANFTLKQNIPWV